MVDPSSKPALPKPKTLDKKESQRIAGLLDLIEHDSNLEFNLTIGRCILAEIYSNRLDVWNEYNQKDMSVDSVVEELHNMGRPHWNRLRIYRDVKLVEQDAYHGGLAKWPNLGASHYFCAQAIELKDQVAVLGEANARKLSVSDLAEIVHNMRSKGRPAEKRQPSHVDEVYRSIEKLRRELSLHDQLFADLQEAGMEIEFIKAFDDFFNRFTRNVEDLVIFLSNMGAQVPEGDLKVFNEHRNKEIEEANKAAEAKRAG